MKAVVAIFVTLFAVSPAYALYCNEKLVSHGDLSSRVRMVCGEPVHISRYVIYEVRSFAAPRRASHQHYRDTHHLRAPYSVHTLVPIEMEEWTYNFGPQRLLHRVTFQNGYLERIETSGYGF